MGAAKFGAKKKKLSRCCMFGCGLPEIRFKLHMRGARLGAGSCG